MMSRVGRRALLVLTAALFLGAGHVVSIGADQGGLTISSGGIDVTGDIVDGDGNTVWDDSNNHVPESILEEDALARDGSESMNGNLDLGNNEMDNIDGLTMNANTIIESPNDGTTIDFSQNVAGDPDGLELRSDTGIKFETDYDGSDGGPFEWAFSPTTGSFYNAVDGGGLEHSDEGNMRVFSEGRVEFDAGNNKEDDCYITDSGELNCDGSKNWIHDLNNTHEAVYSSQESPEVRALYEGRAQVDGPTNITLPRHFEKTVSDEEPELRATVTPQGELAYAAILEKTDSWIVVDASKEVDVNYRVTGIREGYEDKDVVRRKE